MSIQVLCSFLVFWVFLAVIEWQEFIICSGINHLSDIWFVEIFSLSLGCLLLSWNQMYLFLILFMLLTSHLRNHCQIKDHKFMPIFSFKSFIVFGLTFRSLIHFELIFVYGIREGSNFIPLYVNISCPASFVEKTIISLLNFLDILVKNKLTVKVRVYFSTLKFFIHIFVYPVPISHCLVYCSFVVRFEIMKYVSSNFVLFFFSQHWFDYSGSLEFSCEYWDQLVNFCKVVSWDFLRDCIECVGDSGTIAVLTKLSPLIHTHGCLSTNVGLQFLSTIFCNFQSIHFVFLC